MSNSGQHTTQRRTSRAQQNGAADPPTEKALGEYQTALKWIQEGKYQKALPILEKLSHEGPIALQERVRTYKAACERHEQSDGLTFENTEEQYDYAISLLNTGAYEEARSQFKNILDCDHKADYAYYGLAILESMTGQVEPCLEHLAKSIELNPRNRIQARSDSDFQDMADDPRFTELLYPEVP